MIVVFFSFLFFGPTFGVHAEVAGAVVESVESTRQNIEDSSFWVISLQSNNKF